MSVRRNGVSKFLQSDGKAVATLIAGAGSDGPIFDAQHKLVFVPTGRGGTLAIILLEVGIPKLLQTFVTEIKWLFASPGPEYRQCLPAGRQARASGAAGSLAYRDARSFEILVLDRK